MMERMAWTDERLQDRFDSIDRRFDSVDHRFNRVDAEILELRREMNAGFAGLRGEIDSLRTVMVGIGGTLLVAVIASGLIQG
jgi:hypothetical protein